MKEMFALQSPFIPTGDQPTAIAELVAGLARKDAFQTLLGATGTGKTFTISNVIKEINRPTLVLSHNKTLAAQLYAEFKQFFPENAVEFFISYYDYFQPEAYMPTTDTYIEKDMMINDEIDRLRLKATTSLLSGRRDVIVIASVSAIYGLGSPEEYRAQVVELKVGTTIDRDEMLRTLVTILYSRNDVAFERGTFRVRGDVVEIFPAYFEDIAYRIEFWGDEIERISQFEPLTGNIIQEENYVVVYPARNFVSSPEMMEKALLSIEEELRWRLAILKEEGKILEMQRLEQRTLFDLEMMRELGYCSGIENYSRHLTGLPTGHRPYCLFDYFPDDYVVVIDESHVTLPQFRGMYNGNLARKLNLIEYGFRLPSALDNRPMKFEEFEEVLGQTIFVSATPGDYELEKCDGVFVEQIIRPTGIIDPEVEVRPIKNQIDDLLDEITNRSRIGERVLVTTLTKRMSEDLTDYLSSFGVKVRYMHSEIDTVERIEILRGLRLGEFDVLVGINLLREGLDLPEVSLVAVLDADKEGFLRSERSLIQTAGRAARNVNGKVILYADKITGSMQRMMEETDRRRIIQIAYNEEHGIIPQTIIKSIDEVKQGTVIADHTFGGELAGYNTIEEAMLIADTEMDYLSAEKKAELIIQYNKEMEQAADNMEFERAAELRDMIIRLEGN